MKKKECVRKSVKESIRPKSDYELLKKKISGLITQENFLEDEANYQKVMDIVAKVIAGKPQETFSKITINHLVEQFKNVAILIYLYMQKSDDFGLMGEQRISISFCRIILGIPANKALTQRDANNFMRIIDDYDNKFGNKTANKYLRMAIEYDLDFYGKKIISKNAKKIIPYLDFMKIKIFLYSSFGKYPRFILAKAKKLHINQYDVFILNKELIRTPDMPLSIVGRREIVTIIRKESCEVVFFNEWMSFFESTTYDRRKALNHPYSAIREGLEKKALSLYNVYNLEDALKLKSTFNDAMVDGILWHELGHVINEKEMDPVLKTMLNSLDYPEFAVTVLGEVIADWSPELNGAKGAFARFLEIAQKDSQKAHRDIYVYLSENWYGDEIYALRTDVLTGIAISFIEKDGSVNFNRIEKEINNIYQFAMDSIKSFSNQIMEIFQTELYTILDDKKNVKKKKMNHDALDRAMMENYKRKKKKVSLEDLYKDGDFWDKKLVYLQKNTPNGQKRLDSQPEAFAAKLRIDVLKYVTNNHPEKYDHSLREYIIARYREIGVLVDPPMVDYKKISNQIFKKMNMDKKGRANVWETVNEILSGKLYLMITDSMPSPFVNFIQEILLKTNPMEIRGLLERGFFDDITMYTIAKINLALRWDEVMLWTMDEFFLESIFLAYQNGHYPD